MTNPFLLALDAAAERRPDAPALLGTEGALDFSALRRLVHARAAELSGDAPLPLVVRPCTDEIVTLLGALVAGRAVLPLHPRLPEAERARLIGAARPVAGPALLVPTSGSTGGPRLVPLSAGALFAAADALLARLPLAPDDRWLLCLPLSHVGGLQVLVRSLRAMTAVVLVPEFSATGVDEAILRHGATRLSAVPTIAELLLPGALARLRLVLLGGQAAPPSLRRRLDDAGVTHVTSYGLTESAAAVSCETPEEGSRLGPGAGRALPGVRLELRDEQGRPARAGRIFVGPPGAAAASPLVDTGDAGRLARDGTLHVHGRIAETIVTGGEKVLPGEVEAALRALPGVRDAVVFGLPDPRWGELVAAVLECGAGAPLDAELHEALRATLPPWSLPRRFARVPALPRLASGKVDRASVRRDSALR